MEKALEVMGCGYSMSNDARGEMRSSDGCLIGSGLDSGGSSFALSLQALGGIFDPIERRMNQKVASKRAEIGLSINPYAIDESHFLMDEILGVGGFGLVRLAMRVSLSSVESPSKLYAVKTIPKGNVLAKTNGVLSVYNELNCLRALAQSPFICRAHHAFNDSRQLYLVLEYAAGGDFRMNLRKQPKGIFSESVARFYIAQCILAIIAVHEAGIIHRDIKPENLLLDKSGNLKVTDFGVAKFIPSGECRSTSGTHGYMSPEIYAPGHRHGPPADFFALGVTLHELVVGSRPFDGMVLKAYANAKVREGKHGSGHNSSSSNGGSSVSGRERGGLPPIPQQQQQRGASRGRPVMSSSLDASVLGVTRSGKGLALRPGAGVGVLEEGKTDRETSLPTSPPALTSRALSLLALARANVSPHCRDFVASALHLQSSHRLGYHGAHELLEHPWMQNMDWPRLQAQRLIPPLTVHPSDQKREAPDLGEANLSNHIDCSSIGTEDDQQFYDYHYMVDYPETRDREV